MDQVDGKEQYKVKQTWTVPVDMMIGSDGPTTDPEKAVTVISGEIVSVGNVQVAADSGRVVRLMNNVDGKLGIELKGALAQQAPFTKMNLTLGGQAGLAPATAADEAEPAPAAPTAAKKQATGTAKGSSGKPTATKSKGKTKAASGKGG